jgi:hypothetical protein
MLSDPNNLMGGLIVGRDENFSYVVPELISLADMAVHGQGQCTNGSVAQGQCGQGGLAGGGCCNGADDTQTGGSQSCTAGA